jgi:hypothetical protein
MTATGRRVGRCHGMDRDGAQQPRTYARTGSMTSARYRVDARVNSPLLLYLDRRGTPKVRLHGRPRSDRKRRFLLSAVAPSTSTRHPREARPINWAQRGGLASGREMSSDAEATFHRASCTLGNQVIVASDGTPLGQERRPTRVGRTLGAGSSLLTGAALCRPGDGPWVATAC